MTKSQRKKNLKALLNASHSAFKLAQWFKVRENSAKVTKVRVACAHTGAPYTELVSTFKLLETIGFGRFVKGARGHESRFIWRIDFKQAIAKV